MLIIPVNELMKGDLLGRGLYSEDGRLMLKQGVTLNESLIEGIKRLGYSYIFVEMTDHRTSISNLEIKRNLMNQTKEVLQQVFQSMHDKSNFNVRPLLNYTMDRLRRANQQIYDLTFLNVRSRIIKKLIYMMEDYASEDQNEYVIPMKITHQQLAEMVGAVRETVSKVLQELQDEGLILIQDKMIHLQNLKLLRAKISDED
jgi:hypothetical protein